MGQPQPLVGYPSHLMGAGQHYMGGQPQFINPNEQVLYDERPVKEWRRWALGLPITSIAASGTGTPNAQPQRPYQAQRLIVSSIVAAFFDITQLDVGQGNQLTASNPLPAQGFVENAVDAYVSFDAAAVSQQVTIGFTNNDTVNAHNVNTFFLGIAGKP